MNGPLLCPGNRDQITSEARPTVPPMLRLATTAIRVHTATRTVSIASSATSCRDDGQRRADRVGASFIDRAGRVPRRAAQRSTPLRIGGAPSRIPADQLDPARLLNNPYGVRIRSGT